MAVPHSTPAQGNTVRPRELHYSFDLSHAGQVHITLAFQLASRSGEETLLLPSRWAEARGLERGIADLHAGGDGTTLERAGEASRATVHARPGSQVRVEYDLRQDWEGPFRSSERHRVLLRPELMVFSGENALVAPALSPEAPVHAVFSFSGLPAGESLVTSFGSAPQQESTCRWGDVANALFVGGRLTAREITVQGSPVLLASYGPWSFSTQELALKVHQILAAERAFWRDAAIPWYAVVLLPFESASSGGGGTAFTNAFSLTLAPNHGFDTDTESLLAHEAFHEWNPGRLGRSAGDPALEWFVEGFTTYYGDVLLEQSGLLDRAGYLQRLNALLREYQILPGPQPASSPGANSSFDQEEFAYREPYLRGAAIALWLDSEIAQQSQGRQSLADYMRALAAEGEQPLTSERLFRTAARYVDAETVSRLRSYAAAQRPAPVRAAAALGVCARLESRPAWTFALGLPLHSLQAGAVLAQVAPDGPAYRAGLRDGDTVQGWTVWSGDPDRAAVITVTTAAGARRQARFFPRGVPTTVQQVVLQPPCEAVAETGETSAGPRAETPASEQ